VSTNVRVTTIVEVDGVVKSFSISAISEDVMPERVAKSLATSALTEAHSYLNEKITDRLCGR
jgi:hypothetical protein